MTFTQAAQLRLTQRSIDTGWVVAEAVLERADTAAATTWISTLSTQEQSVLSLDGGAAYYQGLFTRMANWKAVPHRLYLGSLAPVSSIQRAGTISHIKPDGTVYDYEAVVVPGGYIQPMNIPFQQWQCVNVGDKFQFANSWTLS